MASTLPRLEDAAALSVGTKGMRLRQIEAAGYRTPPSWVIPSTVQREVFALSGVKSVLDLRSTKTLMLPVWLKEAIRTLVESLRPGVRLVVRSSCDKEDLPFASASGQYETFLSLRTCESIETAVVECYRSISHAGVHRYLRQMGIDPESQRMAILVQEMIEVERAGVMYTSSPFDQSATLIEYTKGSGVSVVAGVGHPVSLSRPRLGVPEPQQSENPKSGEASFKHLQAAGLALETLFGTAQDVEWGIASANLMIFQSRDIVGREPLTLQRVFEAIEPSGASGLVPLSWGLGFGRLVESTEPDLCASHIVLQHEAKGGATETPTDLARITGGLLRTSGGQLSHLASVCRELDWPAAVIDPVVGEALLGRVVCIDCENRLLFDAEALSCVERKRFAFDWARLLGRRWPDRVREEVKVEGVITDGAVVRKLWDRCAAAAGTREEITQRILPFEFPERAYCGVSARIQLEPQSCRVQFKHARVGVNERCRRDHEVHIVVADETEGSRLLGNLGYVERPVQERLVTRLKTATATIQFNYWPFASGAYVGIEAATDELLLQSLHLLDVQPDAVAALDGLDLFRLFRIRLDHCTFPAHERLSMRSVVEGMRE